MQNIPVPNQAAILNNTAASAAAAKAGKKPANAGNDAPAFKDVLAKQAGQAVREASGNEQVMQRQQLQLQLLASEEAKGLATPELGAEHMLNAQGLHADILHEDALIKSVEEIASQETDPAMSAQDALASLSAIEQPTLSVVTPDVQRRPAVNMAVELETDSLKRQPLDWSRQGEGMGDARELQGLKAEAPQMPAPGVEEGHDSPVKFADTLAQASQAAVTVAQPQHQTHATQATVVMDARGSQIPVPFGQPGWNQAVGQKVVWMAAGGEQTASLTLNPPDLGPVQVIIHVHNNQADTTFLSDQADVRRALEDGMDNLRQMMSESGLQLGQANVRSGQQEAAQTPSGLNVTRTGSDGAGEENSQVLAKAARVMGLVDTFV